jgi:hypothetical protein
MLFLFLFLFLKNPQKLLQEHIYSVKRKKKGVIYMAVESTKIASALKLTMKTGVDSKGKDKLVVKTLSNIKLTAADEDIFAIGEAISNIKTYPLVSLNKEDQYSLVSV